MTAPTPITISFSELDAIRQCGHKFDLLYRQRWVADTTSPALRRGIAWHRMLAEHYNSLKASATKRERVRAVFGALQGANDDDSELLAWMFDGYVERYGLDRDWEILAVEEAGLTRLPTATGRPSRFWMRRRTDLIVREKFGPTLKRKIWLVDHKTGQNLPTEKELDLDDQFGLYTWGLRKDGLPVFGSIYSAARTHSNKTGPPAAWTLDDRYSRTRLYRADPELETIAREAFLTARAAFRYKVGEAPRAPDSDRCRWRCPMTEPCLLGRKAGPEAERRYLQASFRQVTEAELLAHRGYGPDAGGGAGRS